MDVVESDCGNTVLTGKAIVINPAASTYQVTITGVTAKGAISNQTIVLPGLPVIGTTVTVNK